MQRLPRRCRMVLTVPGEVCRDGEMTVDTCKGGDTVLQLCKWGWGVKPQHLVLPDQLPACQAASKSLGEGGMPPAPVRRKENGSSLPHGRPRAMLPGWERGEMAFCFIKQP